MFFDDTAMGGAPVDPTMPDEEVKEGEGETEKTGEDAGTEA